MNIDLPEEPIVLKKTECIRSFFIYMIHKREDLLLELAKKLRKKRKILFDTSDCQEMYKRLYEDLNELSGDFEEEFLDKLFDKRITSAVIDSEDLYDLFSMYAPRWSNYEQIDEILLFKEVKRHPEFKRVIFMSPNRLDEFISDNIGKRFPFLKESYRNSNISFMNDYVSILNPDLIFFSYVDAIYSCDLLRYASNKAFKNYVGNVIDSDDLWFLFGSVGTIGYLFYKFMDEVCKHVKGRRLTMILNYCLICLLQSWPEYVGHRMEEIEYLLRMDKLNLDCKISDSDITFYDFLTAKYDTINIGRLFRNDFAQDDKVKLVVEWWKKKCLS